MRKGRGINSIILLIVIIIIINLNSHLVLGAEESIEVDYPNEVKVDEEFELTIRLIDFDEDEYDIKIEILNNSRNIGKRYWDNNWKSTNYWMEDGIDLSRDDEERFRVRIEEDYDEVNIFKIKIRDSDDEVWEFENYLLNIEGNSNKDDNSNNDIDYDNDIYVELDWNDNRIENGDDFKIDFELFNLEDQEYDIKIWIEDEDDGNVISDRYDDNENEWKSGTYYIDNFIDGPGDKSGDVKLKIRDSYDDFIGDGFIFFRIREGYEYNESIEVIKKKINNPIVNEENRELDIIIPNKKKPEINNEVVRLGKIDDELGDDKDDGNGDENSKPEDNINDEGKDFESSTEIVKKYSVLFFALLCVIMTILMGWSKLE